EFVKIDICQDRAENASLGGAQQRVVRLFLPQVTCPKGFPDQIQEAFIRNLLPKQRNQGVVVNFIKARLDISFHDPDYPCSLVSEFPQGRVAASLGSETMTAIEEVRSKETVVNHFKDEMYGLLNDLVPWRGDPERSGFAVGLGDEHPSGRLELKAFVPEALDD